MALVDECSTRSGVRLQAYSTAPWGVPHCVFLPPVIRPCPLRLVVDRLAQPNSRFRPQSWQTAFSIKRRILGFRARWARVGLWGRSAFQELAMHFHLNHARLIHCHCLEDQLWKSGGQSARCLVKHIAVRADLSRRSPNLILRQVSHLKDLEGGSFRRWPTIIDPYLWDAYKNQSYVHRDRLELCSIERRQVVAWSRRDRYIPS